MGELELLRSVFGSITITEGVLSEFGVEVPD